VPKFYALVFLYSLPNANKIAVLFPANRKKIVLFFTANQHFPFQFPLRLWPDQLIPLRIEDGLCFIFIFLSLTSDSRHAVRLRRARPFFHFISEAFQNSLY
jgi:hypothetical protein